MEEFRFCFKCGGNASEPDHELRCDGQQGGIEESEPPLDLTAGKIARDAAMTLVYANASQEFKESAMASIYSVARHRPLFTTDQVWSSRSSWPSTHDKRAMGTAIIHAKKLGWIEPTDTFQSTARASRHAAPVRVWRSKLLF